MVKVSVIVPIYQVESYLEKCLDSIVHQTLKEIEIILVDDGSMDSSSEIAKSYQKKDKRILYIKQENQGLSGARNTGLTKAKGEYVAFIDSDDYIEKNMLDEMYQLAKRKNLDLVECDFYWEYPNKKRIDHRNYHDDYFHQIRVVSWNKLYKREIIEKEKLSFYLGLRYEDIGFTYQFLPFVKSYGCVDKPLYHYLQRTLSITSVQNERVKEIFIILTKVLDFYKEKGLYDKYKVELEYLFLHVILGRSSYRISQIKEKKLRKSILKEGWNLLNQEFPNWKENLYLKEKKDKMHMYFRHLTYSRYLISNVILRYFGKKIIKE